MENFIFALNATIPVFLMILLGFFLQKIHFLNEPFNQTANAYVFRCALPVSLFLSIAEMDFYSDFDLTFCLFCFLAVPALVARCVSSEIRHGTSRYSIFVGAHCAGL